LFEKALRELDEKKRNDLFAKCDQMIVDQAPVLPILTDDFMVMINARIRDFRTNSMENLDFSTIFIKEPRK
jgi:peptide/nickel transport system substrate-binding protein